MILDFRASGADTGQHFERTSKVATTPARYINSRTDISQHELRLFPPRDALISESLNLGYLMVISSVKAVDMPLTA